MAKYDISYCCRHGSVIKDLVGPMKERERRIEWMESNMLCPECFKEKLKADKAAEPRKARISLHLQYGNVLHIEVKGQLDESESALRRLGYHWMIPTQNGSHSNRRPEPFLAKNLEFRSKKEMDRIVKETTADLAAIGYQCVVSEFGWRELFRIRDYCWAIKTMSKALKADPRPSDSALRIRISELEDDSRCKWNGTIYGWNASYFFVGGVTYPATNAEVEEHRKQEHLLAAWKNRYPKLR